jgi:Abortive infection C-terminus
VANTSILLPLPPLTEGIAYAAARLVDDRPDARRYPAHYDLDRIIKECGLESADPKQAGPVGKAKRMRIVLLHALDHDELSGQRLLNSLVTSVRSEGGFRPESSNYVGPEAIANLAGELRAHGFELTSDGHLSPLVVTTFAGPEVTDVLQGYARRAQRGAEDAALIVGTSKDLLEATAAHVLLERSVPYDPSKLNFPDLLSAAFLALHMAIPRTAPKTPTPQQRLELAWFDAACAINTLRNRQGTGHGRPFLPTVTQQEATSAVQQMGLIAADMLRRL